MKHAEMSSKPASDAPVNPGAKAPLKRIQYIDRKIQRLISAIEDGEAVDFVRSRLSELKARRDAAVKNIARVQDAGRPDNRFTLQSDELPGLLRQALASPRSQRAHNAIRDLVETVEIEEQEQDLNIRIKLCPTSLISPSSKSGLIPLSGTQIKLVAGYPAPQILVR